MTQLFYRGCNLIIEPLSKTHSPSDSGYNVPSNDLDFENVALLSLNRIASRQPASDHTCYLFR